MVYDCGVCFLKLSLRMARNSWWLSQSWQSSWVSALGLSWKPLKLGAVEFASPSYQSHQIIPFITASNSFLETFNCDFSDFLKERFQWELRWELQWSLDFMSASLEPAFSRFGGGLDLVPDGDLHSPIGWSLSEGPWSPLGTYSSESAQKVLDWFMMRLYGQTMENIGTYWNLERYQAIQQFRICTTAQVPPEPNRSKSETQRPISNSFDFSPLVPEGHTVYLSRHSYHQFPGLVAKLR